MKTIILNLTNPKNARKLKGKENILKSAEKDNCIIIDDDSSRVIGDVISKNQDHISDMYVVILAQSCFNESKIRYKKKLKMSNEEELIELCDSELSEKEKEIAILKQKVAELEQENSSLKSRVLSLETAISHKEEKQTEDKVVSIFVDKDIKELYPGEIKNFIIDMLKNKYDNVKDKTRKKNIIEAILNSNDIVEVDLSNIFDRSIDSDCSIMDSISELKQCGFEIIKCQNNHYKIQLEHGKYGIVLGSTVSDYRAKNNAIATFRTMFLLEE